MNHLFPVFGFFDRECRVCKNNTTSKTRISINYDELNNRLEFQRKETKTFSRKRPNEFEKKYFQCPLKKKHFEDQYIV